MRRLSERWKLRWIKRWDLKNPLTDHQVHELKQARQSIQSPAACAGRNDKMAINCCTFFRRTTSRMATALLRDMSTITT